MQHVQQEYVQYQTEAPPSYCYTQVHLLAYQIIATSQLLPAR